jgi:hypothetical protein
MPYYIKFNYRYAHVFLKDYGISMGEIYVVFSLNSQPIFSGECYINGQVINGIYLKQNQNLKI